MITAANTCVPTVAGIEASGATPVLVDVDEATFTLDPGELARGDDGADAGDRAGAPLRPVRRRRARSRRSRASTASRSSRTPRRRTAPRSADDGRARSAPPPRSASTRRRTSARSATPAPSSPTTRPSRTRCASFGASASGAAEPPCAAAATAASTRCRPRSCSVKLPHLERWNERRRALAAPLRRRALAGTIDTPRRAPNGAPRLPPLRRALARGGTRSREALARRGIGTLVHYPRAVHEHPAYAALARPGKLARSERLAREVLSLPLYPELDRRRGARGRRRAARGVRCLTSSVATRGGTSRR